MNVCINQNLINERLFNYFIFPRIEQIAGRMKFSDYIETLNLLCVLQYQEDKVFWNDHVLAAIFNFYLSLDDATLLWQSFMKVKINCPNIDISKHLTLVENLIQQLENVKATGQDISKYTIKLTPDANLIPKKVVSKISIKKLKESEEHLKDKATIRAILGNVSQTEAKIETYEENLNKLFEIKDWKKAKYEFNLEEMKQMKEMAEKRAEEEEQERVAKQAKEKEEPTKATLEKPQIAAEKVVEESIEEPSKEAELEPQSSAKNVDEVKATEPRTGKDKKNKKGDKKKK